MVEYGKLQALITDELVELCRGKQYIVITGPTRSGKEVIAKSLSDKLGVEVLRSDDYMYLGFEKGMYEMRTMIFCDLDKSWIIEGCQTERLLRKGVEEKDFYPEIVINLTISKASLIECYVKAGASNNVTRALNWNKMLDKIYNDWLRIQKGTKIITLDTSFI